ncbi:hypothetical protein D6C00_06325 [Thiohalobacter thiocyanaticus]|uniref:Uncharacterized protein n=1 Tax=Thiohalobacter thiocyanaticus TaxID=585455 RepID=A0A426QIM3_9GAMM|nr:hypothetical protein D6C00_06325 [Thiohalobacter thiocyanaticus]
MLFPFFYIYPVQLLMRFPLRAGLLNFLRRLMMNGFPIRVFRRKCRMMVSIYPLGQITLSRRFLWRQDWKVRHFMTRIWI